MSVIVTDPLRAPVAVGVKVTLMVQVAPAATEAPQVFVCVKFPALVPVTVMLVMFSAPLPLFVRVTGSGALVVLMLVPGNVRLLGDKLTAAGVVPVPVMVMVVFPATTLSVIRIFPKRTPSAVGLKVAEMVQLAPTARLDGEMGQVLVWA